MTATGTITLPVDTLTLVRSDGCNTYWTEAITIVYAGGLSGTSHYSGTAVIHCDGTQDGKGTEVCSACTIDGKTGTFTDFGGYTFTGTSLTGHIELLSASGGLAGLHMEGTYGLTTYSYNYHFNP